MRQSPYPGRSSTEQKRTVKDRASVARLSVRLSSRPKPSRERSVVRVSDSHFTCCARVSRPRTSCAPVVRGSSHPQANPHTRGPKSGGPQFLVSHSHAISRRIDFVAHSESNVVVSLCERELPPGMQAEQLRRTLPLPLPKREGCSGFTPGGFASTGCIRSGHTRRSLPQRRRCGLRRASLHGRLFVRVAALCV